MTRVSQMPSARTFPYSAQKALMIQAWYSTSSAETLGWARM